MSERVIRLAASVNVCFWLNRNPWGSRDFFSFSRVWFKVLGDYPFDYVTFGYDAD